MSSDDIQDVLKAMKTPRSSSAPSPSSVLPSSGTGGHMTICGHVHPISIGKEWEMLLKRTRWPLDNNVQVVIIRFFRE